MDGEGNLPESFLDPRFLSETDPVLAGDRPAVLQNPGEKDVERSIRAFPYLRISVILDHEISMDISVACVTEAGNGNTGFELQHTGEFYEFDELAAWDDDIFVELGQSSIP